ncbi:MAG: putative hydrolase or acyltransferase of alpha/beta superfamily [Actinobacteria bacterium]|nr:putative hydrolase or acyltransferase of alpha/beta superfamily [Actinomycetota bacterium]
MSRGRWLARGAGLWALWRLLGPRLAPPCAAGQERPAGPAGRTVFAAGHEFFVREAGPDGAPRVLLLHGWALDSLGAWHRVMPGLTGEVRVVAVDLRGHGKSDRIRERYSVEDLADDVAAVLDALGPGRYIVVGYSLGGLVAQALARRHPARVERLVLAATASRVGPGPRWAAVPLLMLQRALGRLGADVVPRAMHRYLLQTGAIPPEHSAWLWETLAGRDNELHYQAGFALARFDSAAWVGRLDLPALCIVPTRDQLVPPARQRATAALISGATVVEIAGARHEALFTHAGELAAAIRGFAGVAPSPVAAP